jgi:hypothetical protein
MIFWLAVVQKREKDKSGEARSRWRASTDATHTP